MAILEAFLVGVLLSAGVNCISIKCVKDKHAKEVALLVQELREANKEPIKEVPQKSTFTFKMRIKCLLLVLKKMTTWRTWSFKLALG